MELDFIGVTTLHTLLPSSRGEESLCHSFSTRFMGLDFIGVITLHTLLPSSRSEGFLFHSFSTRFMGFICFICSHKIKCLLSLSFPSKISPHGTQVAVTTLLNSPPINLFSSSTVPLVKRGCSASIFVLLIGSGSFCFSCFTKSHPFMCLSSFSVLSKVRLQPGHVSMTNLSYESLAIKFLSFKEDAFSKGGRTGTLFLFFSGRISC
mmetsp:Transcript_11697/g.13022  ORF Transcript_11697/g.13022 Transcript_11697/m.13022 type:complete len:207 (-) Transcript_11697:497-1117(-)